MREVTDELRQFALAPARRIGVFAAVQSPDGSGGWTDPRVYEGTDKVSGLSIDIGKSSGGLTIGGAFCGKLTLQLLGDVNIKLNDRIQVRIDFKGTGGIIGTYIEMGMYYVDSVKTVGKSTMVTAYDIMLQGSKAYKSELTYPCTTLDIVSEICGKMDIALHPDFTPIYNHTITEPPVKSTAKDGTTAYYTYREVLGYIAALWGGSWFIDGSEYLSFTRFETVSEDMLAKNSISAEISDEAYTVKGIIWNINGISYARQGLEDVYGVLEFSNPLSVSVKEAVMGNLEKRLVGLTYHNATIQRQGCGWYELGDIVNTYKADGTYCPVLITGIHREIKNGGYTEKIYSSALTERESNYTSGDIVGQTVPQSVAAVQQSANTGSALTEYEYLSDLCVKYNGITYTAEKDSTTGLISKISDSNGGEFEPTINSGVSDVALHNAVFWAVAMHSGLSKSAMMPIINGLVGYFDAYKYGGGPEWVNMLDGANPLKLYNANLTSNAVLLTKSGGYGEFNTSLEQRIIYCIYRTTEQTSSTGSVLAGWQHIVAKWFGANTNGNAFGIATSAKNLIAATSNNYAAISEVTSYNEWHIVAAVFSDDTTAALYVDGVHISDFAAVRGDYKGSYYLSRLRNDDFDVLTSVPVEFKFVAFGTTSHTAEQIAKNTEWLKNYYGI